MNHNYHSFGFYPSRNFLDIEMRELGRSRDHSNSRDIENVKDFYSI